MLYQLIPVGGAWEGVSYFPPFCIFLFFLIKRHIALLRSFREKRANAKYNWTVLLQPLTVACKIFTSWIGLKPAKLRMLSKGNQGSYIVDQNRKFSLVDQNGDAWYRKTCSHLTTLIKACSNRVWDIAGYLTHQCYSQSDCEGFKPQLNYMLLVNGVTFFL